MNHDLLDGLYASRRELTRIIVATASQKVPEDSLEQLLQQRDHIVWTINRILLSQLTASLADIHGATESIGHSTDELAKLASTAKDVSKAINIAGQILSAAGGLLG